MVRKKRKKGSKINLLPQEGFAQTTLGRVLFWLLSSFRVIVIVTELIVMTAFLSRFWLDAQNSDLGEEIQQKSSLIAASASFESEFKDTQKKLIIYSEVSKDNGEITKSLKTLVSKLPTDILLRNLSVRNHTINISATSPSERSIQQFIVNLEAQSDFQKVELTEMGSNVKSPNLSEFSLTITY